ncbi:MAG: hypothetical protein Q9165_008485, partial [Trypethelium subeluteriae]
MAIKALDALEAAFGKWAHFVWLHATEKVACFLSTPSKFNEREVQITIQAASLLMQQGYAPTDIMILSPYTAHQRLLQRALNLARRQTPNFSQIRVMTLDTLQGGEAEIIIATFAVDKQIGFLREDARVNVIFSRAKSLLCLVGNSEAIYDKQWERTLLYKLLRQIR